MNNCILVTGYSKAPHGTSMYEVYKHAGVVLKIDLKKNTIVDLEFTVIAKLTNDFLRELVIGYCLDEGIDNLILIIKKYYLVPSQQSFVVALQAAYHRYLEHKV